MTRTTTEIWYNLDDKLVELELLTEEMRALQNEMNAAAEGPAPTPPDPAPSRFDPKNPPLHEKVLRVPEDYPNVMAAYEVVEPGQTISCDDGYACGELTLARKLDPKNWVVLRPRNINKALFDKRVRLNGAGLWVHGFKSTFKTTSVGDGAIVLGGDNHILTRMEINSPQGISATGEKRAYIWIGWCLFNGKNNSTSAVSNIVFKMPDGGRYPSFADGPNNIFIYRNDFDDDLTRPAGPMEDHVVYFGDSKPKGNDLLCMRNVEIYQNLIRASNKRVRGFYLKRGAYIYQNQLSGCKYNWGIRHGGYATIESNICLSSAKLVLNGKNHLIVNNKWSVEAQLYAGTSKNGSGPFYQAADYANLDLNDGPLRVGFINGGHTLDSEQGGKADHVTIWRHAGNISLNPAGYEAATYQIKNRPMENKTYLPRMPLTANDVGIWA